MSHRTIGFALATAVGAAVLMSQPAQAQQSGDKERCYGISAAGKNDCASSAGNSCAGTAKMDHDKAAWKYVAKGTCTAMEVQLKNGTKRKGSLEPIKG